MPPSRTWPNGRRSRLDVERAGHRLGALGDDDDRGVAAALVARAMRRQISSMSNGISGIRTIVAPPAMPACVAIHPLWRPITSTTITRSWLSAVVCSRSMASVAICTAVLNPNVTSVPTMSLSIVFGTPTIGRPSSACSRLATDSEPLPPMTMSASRPRSAIVPATSAAPPSVSNGLPRLVPSTVPPRGSVPRIDSMVSGIVLRVADAVPRVEEPDELVAVRPLALAHDRPDHGVQARAVTAAGEHPDTHRAERRGSSSTVLSIRAVGWDSSRPVPWQRLIKEWVIYAGIMAAILLVVFRTADGCCRSSAACSSAARCTSCSARCWPSSATSARRWPSCARRARRHEGRPTPPSRPHARSRRRPGAPPAGPATDRAPSGDDLRRRHRRRHDGHPQPGGVHRRSPDVSSYREFTQHFPRPGWVEHDPTEIWEAVRATLTEVVDQVGRRRGGGHRHHQPARDRRGVGPHDRAAVRQRDRVAGPPNRRPLRRAGRRRRPRPRADPHRPGARPVLQRHQVGVAAGPGRRPGRPPTWPSAPSTPG